MLYRERDVPKHAHTQQHKSSDRTAAGDKTTGLEEGARVMAGKAGLWMQEADNLGLAGKMTTEVGPEPQRLQT